MSQVNPLLMQILRNGLSYRKLSYFKRHFSHVSMVSLKIKHHDHRGFNRFISHRPDVDRKVSKKLHHRILSNEEKEQDRTLSEELEDLTEEDKFGCFVTEKQKIKNENENKAGGSIIDGQNFNRRRNGDTGPYKRKSKTDRWKDTFGTLSPMEETDDKYKDFPDENDEDEKPHIRLSKTNRRYPPDWYAEKIKEFGKQGRVREAIRVYDVWMLEKERVMPTPFVISHLLSVLAKAGYTKKAFQVYNQMKQMRIKPDEHIYSALFNACANSPWQDDGHQRAKLLLEDLALKEIKINSVMFNSMIKAFAVCGDARTAFMIADKYSDSQKLDVTAFGHILMAAIADKKAGFWHAVQIWRWMLIKRVKPDVKIYNLLLRAIKECDVGDQLLAQQLLLPINPAVTMKMFKNKSDSDNISELIKKKDETKNAEIQANIPLITKSNSTSSLKSHDDSLQITPKDVVESDHQVGDINENKVIEKSVQISENQEERLPNILNPNEDFSHIISISNISTPQDRFSMVGGMTGFLADMKRNNVQSNIETFDQMLSLVPPEKEQNLLDVMKKEGVKPDIDLLTNLAHKRTLRLDYEAAKDVLNLIALYQLVPNMRTYSVLAMSCKSLPQGLELLDNMKSAGVEPNLKVIGALVNTSFLNFRYKRVLLQKMVDAGLKPDERMLRTIENQIKKAKKIILQMEKTGNNPDRLRNLDSEYEKFKVFYQTWLNKMELDVPDHPWAPFKETVEAK